MAQKPCELMSILNYFALLLSFLVPPVQWIFGTAQDHTCDEMNYFGEKLNYDFFKYNPNYKNEDKVKNEISEPENRLACLGAGLFAPTEFALFLYNLIIVINIWTKDDMHRYLKLAVLVLGTVVYTLSAYVLLDGALQERYFREKNVLIVSASFYIALALDYLITCILIIIQNFRRTSERVETEAD